MPEDRAQERERERCERGGGAGGGGGGGAGNELNSGKLHLQGSPPVYNECLMSAHCFTPLCVCVRVCACTRALVTDCAN